MIGRNELIQMVFEFGLDVNVIEKDYVLGWLLAGVAQDSALSQSLIFKERLEIWFSEKFDNQK